MSSSSQSSSSLESHESETHLRGNVVMRQELKSFTPNCNIRCGVIVYIVLIILFLSFGLPIIIISNRIKTVSLDFTDCSSTTCSQNFILNDTISPPIYLYYEIKNFYSSHRYYQKSLNKDQLRGKLHVDSSDNKSCQGARYLYEIFENDTSRYHSYSGKQLNAEDYANPCGLIAKSFYNDTRFRLAYEGKELLINETEITNAYDRKYVYHQIPNSSLIQWIDVLDEHFIVWMQMETFDQFKKLWGRIEEEMPIGEYTLSFENNWNVTKFKGKKKLILSDSSMVGTGMFFGSVLCGAALFCIIMLLIIFICEKAFGNKVYTEKHLKWD